MLARNGLTSDKSSCPLATATGPRKFRKLGIAWNLKFVPGKHGITWNSTFFKVKPWKTKFYKIIQVLQFVPTLYKKIQITEFVDRKLFPILKLLEGYALYVYCIDGSKKGCYSWNILSVSSKIVSYRKQSSSLFNWGW